MKPKICLFVGGCLDGKREAVPAEWDVFNAAPPVPESTLCEHSSEPLPSSFTVDRYVRVNIQGAPDVFICGDPAQLLGALINGYTRERG